MRSVDQETGRGVERTIRRLLFDVKTIVAQHPSVALPVARRRHGLPVGPDTQIVIEGFPRSGNTFAVTAFTMSQSRPVRVAGRVHAPAQLIAAARRGIPAVALIRKPDDAVPSFVVRHPHLTLRQALRGYLRFYEPLIPHVERMVVATFDEVIEDFGAVVEEVNRRFQTEFDVFEHNEENVRRCWEAIDSDYRARVGADGSEFERTVARPSDARDQLKERVKDEYRRAGLTRLRASANDLYGRFIAYEELPGR